MPILTPVLPVQPSHPPPFGCPNSNTLWRLKIMNLLSKFNTERASQETLPIQYDSFVLLEERAYIHDVEMT